ncbi:MAG TPA: hypothetical protein VJQ59_01000 [Candidatus Sulfotelmatobacter sp.]|nr:hypothetical protein [Candidatus Sulfotelmatobacter sp.]
MIRRCHSKTALLLAIIFVASYADAQESDQGQAPLGDVVRHQQEARQHGKKAKRVVSDEDVPGSNKHSIGGSIATSVIIPYIMIAGSVPGWLKANAYGSEPGQKMRVWFGPQMDSCFDLGCAKATYMQQFAATSGGTVKILYESDETVGGYPARVEHVEVVHDVRGKLLGIVVLIQSPITAGAATCLYKEEDAAAIEPECDDFVNSIHLRVPERYIYVQHNQY